jgi:hypothetical protein
MTALQYPRLLLCASPVSVARQARTNLRREDGIALVVTLMAMVLMAALGTALVLTTSTEAMIAANFRNHHEALYAADAGLERAMDELPTVPDWSSLLDGSVPSAFTDGSAAGSRVLPDGSTLDLDQVLNLANCGKPTTCSAADLTGNATGDRPWGANNPIWRLYAHNRLDALTPTGIIDSLYYVVVLVGDDPSETDGNPLVDGADPRTNPGSGVLALRAEAFGPRGAHTIIELTVVRSDASGSGPSGQPGVRVLSWREVL